MLASDRAILAFIPLVDDSEPVRILTEQLRGVPGISAFAVAGGDGGSGPDGVVALDLDSTPPFRGARRSWRLLHQRHAFACANGRPTGPLLWVIGDGRP